MKKLSDFGVQEDADLGLLSDSELQGRGFTLLEINHLRLLSGLKCEKVGHGDLNGPDAETTAPIRTNKEEGEVVGAGRGEGGEGGAEAKGGGGGSAPQVHVFTHSLSNMLSLQYVMLLGRGSFASVWLVRDVETGVNFALKHMERESVSKCKVAMRELDLFHLICRNPHPFLVKGYATETLHRACRFVMEYCPGGTLWHQVQNQWSECLHRPSRHRLGMCLFSDKVEFSPPHGARKWIAQVFLALEYLHLFLNILMRDLKLENVLLDRNDVAKLADFGVGCDKPVSHAPWSFNHPPGTRGYAAPEVLRQEDHNYSADLYSFMVLVWMLLTGGIVDDPDHPKPRPPHGSWEGNWTSCAKDFKLFRRYLRNPRCHGVTRAPDYARDFLWGLAQEPRHRLPHRHLRRTQLLHEMDLPPVEATTQAIQGWVVRSCTFSQD